MQNYFSRLLAYILLQISRALGHIRSDLRSVAQRHFSVCPKENKEMRGSIYLKSHIERIKGTNSGNVNAEIFYATMQTAEHAETILYEIENAVYDNGCIYVAGKAYLVSKLGAPTFKKLIMHESMLLCSTPSGSRYFGDWLLSDGLLDAIVDDQTIGRLKIKPHVNYPHSTLISDILAWSRDYAAGPIAIKKLLVPSDVGYNENKRKRLAELRVQVRKKFSGFAGADRVYLARGAAFASTRGLQNESALISYLKSENFLILDPNEHSPYEIFSKIIGCAMVVGVEGSQLSYGFLALRESGVLMAIQPPYRFQASFRPRCDATGLRWGFFVGNEIDDGFRVNIDEFNQFIKSI